MNCALTPELFSAWAITILTTIAVSLLLAGLAYAFWAGFNGR